MFGPLMTAEVDELKEGRFSLDALRMELRSRAGGPGVSYSGPGSLHQGRNGGLEFSLYAAGQEFSITGTGGEPGMRVPEHQFLDLTLEDWRGRRWSSEWLLPDCTFSDSGVILRGTLRQAVCSQSSDPKLPDELWLHIPVDVQIPGNMGTQTVTTARGREISRRFEQNRWVIDAPNYEFEVVRTGAGLDVTVTAKGTRIPSGFDTRIVETFWFVLGRPLESSLVWHRIEGNEAFYVAEQRSQYRSPRLRPPVEFWQPGLFKAATELFVKYLDYITPYKDPRYHPTSVNLLRVLRGSASSIQTEALELAVAIEDLAAREFEELGKPTKEEVAELERTIRHLESAGISEGMNNRIKGALGRMKGPNARTALRTLAEGKVVTQQQLQAWEQVRPRSAHAHELNVPPGDLIQLCDKMYMMFLRMLFRAIGYSGPYTDRSMPGWPTLTFPDSPG